MWSCCNFIRWFELVPPDCISLEIKEEIRNLSFQSYHPRKKIIVMIGPAPSKKNNIVKSPFIFFRETPY